MAARRKMPEFMNPNMKGNMYLLLHPVLLSARRDTAFVVYASDSDPDDEGSPEEIEVVSYECGEVAGYRRVEFSDGTTATVAVWASSGDRYYVEATPGSYTEKLLGPNRLRVIQDGRSTRWIEEESPAKK